MISWQIADGRKCYTMPFIARSAPLNIVHALLRLICDMLFRGSLLYLGNSVPASQRYAEALARSDGMFDVYLNEKRNLLVVKKGLPIPSGEAGTWRKKKTKVASVSDEIRLAVQRYGYYRRKLGERV